MKNNDVLKKRNIGYDLMRLIAIVMVLYNHRILYSYFLISNNNIEKIFLSILAIISRCGPPLFFFISGALLLGKKEKVADILKHRVLRVFIVMLIVSIYAFFRWNSGATFVQIFFTRLNWYLYAYIAYLLMLPLLRSMVTNLSDSQMRYLLICATVFYSLGGILPIIGFGENFLTNLTLFNSMWGSNCWHILFPCLGYAFITLINDNNRKKYELLLLAGTILTFIVACLLLKYDGIHHNSANVEQILQHATLIPCSFIFVFIYDHFKDKSIKSFIAKPLSIISGATFGVFLIETHSPVSTMIYNYIGSHIGNIYLSTFATIFVSLTCLSIVVALLRLIPVLKKIL